ncbi:redoxin domain-containing protein [Candidatus Poribacteria bacterium]|nr:redoxin domain-containing protein [Candidatus Poribacteria bacterium]
MKVNLGCLVLSLFLSVLAIAKQDVPPKVGDTAPEFSLQDTEEKLYDLKKLRGKIVFLIMGNRRIRKEDDKWAEAFQSDYKENEKIVAFIIGDLRSVPGFIPKRFVLSQLKKKPPPLPFLLDWKGKIHQAYHTEKKKPNLYLISTDGKLIYHRKANYSLENYNELKEKITIHLKHNP